MKVEVSYGSSKLELDIPQKNLAGVIVPKQVAATSKVAEELERVMTNPHGPSLDQLSKSKSVCVMVEDHTRDAPHEALLRAVVPFITDANRIQFIITTGSHVVDHPGNHEIVQMIHRAAADVRLRNFKIVINDCQGPEFVDLGKTSRGTPVIVNPAAVNHDVYVPLSDMKAHYFAGYSNAIKNFFPGVCSFDAIEANHAMSVDPRATFGIHPYHPDPERRNNPLADDMREAMEIMTRDAKIFALAVVSAGEKLVWADAGSVKPVIASGIDVLEETASFTVQPTSRIIVSPGGYPQDKSLYHAQRGLELTKNAVKDDGEVLFLAECRDGIAPEKAIENFYNKLTSPLEEVISSIRGRYHLYEHKAFKFAELLQRISRLRMYTDLDQKTVEAAHLDKEDDAQAVIDEWIDDDPRTKIQVFDKSNKLAIYAK